MEDKYYVMRRRSLRVVLVLSLIGSGSSFISSLIMAIGIPAFKSLYESGIITYPAEMTVFIEQLLETPRSLFLFYTLLYAMSIVGIIMMWNIRKSGFHMYTLAQLLLLLVTVLFLGRDRLALGDVMFTLLFVVYYFIAIRQLDAMKQNQIQEGADKQEDGNEDEGKTRQ